MLISKLKETDADDPEGVTVMHIALQGCLRAGDIHYGVTNDTGGHIRYLLELVDRLAKHPQVARQIIVTRRFDDPALGNDYSVTQEWLSPSVELWRCRGETTAYLPKEALWREIPALRVDLLARLEERRIRPHWIHAHYADGGSLAREIEAETGVPYVFTAHSLVVSKYLSAPEAGGGKTESQATDLSQADNRRYRQELEAICNAGLAIAGTDQERTGQYGQYGNAALARTVVNPAGCRLRSFTRDQISSNSLDVLTHTISRFLREPDKPCLLAIARPVIKKNLVALVRAYGENAALRERANLVIYAGTRTDLALSKGEAGDVWRELLEVVDRYDLYGSVALPKHHEPHQVPAIYAWAAARQGVFVNPALNEPFGLTLLEAAAAGLPVVATCYGGPVDIVGRLHNGVLVDPADERLIGDTCLTLLNEPHQWQAYRDSGLEAVKFYSWERHVNQYLREVGQALLPNRRPLPSDRNYTRMLACDMDNTLLGDVSGLLTLRRWLHEHPECLFVVATGRCFDETIGILSEHGAPTPDLLVTDVGSSIHGFDRRGEPVQIAHWSERLNYRWQPEACQQALARCPGIELQPGGASIPYKLSYYADSPEIRDQVAKVLVGSGLSTKLVLSHGRLLDILPEKGGKSGAVMFIAQTYGIAADCVIAAGDSGNDLDMLQAAGGGIVVAGHNGELDGLRDSQHIFWASQPAAAGICAGLAHFNQQPSTEPGPAAVNPSRQRQRDLPLRIGSGA